jgi:hypothetical protein
MCSTTCQACGRSAADKPRSEAERVAGEAGVHGAVWEVLEACAFEAFLELSVLGRWGDDTLSLTPRLIRCGRA